jgi:hypothetical protein
MVNYYDILEISPTASDEVIHSAYKALVKKYHPDVYEGDSEFAHRQMLKINEAYEVLSDAEKRRQYDMQLHSEHQQQSVTEEEPPEPEYHSQPYYQDSEPYSQSKNHPGCLFSLIKLCIFLYIIYAAIRFLGGKADTISSYISTKWSELSSSVSVEPKYYANTKYPTFQSITGIPCSTSSTDRDDTQIYDGYVSGCYSYTYENAEEELSVYTDNLLELGAKKTFNLNDIDWGVTYYKLSGVLLAVSWHISDEDGTTSVQIIIPSS